jgi:AAA15 family ATPase/GTPase
MVIQRAEISKFRGFKDVSFELGTFLTIIAGQNGTQKTTILGVLSQPFTITEGVMKDEKPLSGGNFKSAFSEKFKLSDKFDIAKSHEWTLHISNEEPFTIESIPRSKSGIRFWKKGDRSKGSGYIQLPVIFLSLKRLLPIGEDSKLEEKNLLNLTPAEQEFFKTWHKRILISLDEITDTNYLESPDKNTLGISTNQYDWRLNSSGQDNVGKILLAVLSFKRLKLKYPDEYTGGILTIDELDATIYPASQLKLLDALRKFSSDYAIQIICTTHSLTILERACELEAYNSTITKAKDQIKVIFLEKRDNKILIIQKISFRSIKHKLDVTITGVDKKKISAFTEDRECIIFTKALLKSKATRLNFVDATFGCGTLVDMGTKKIPSFSFPEAIAFLDGDVRIQTALYKRIKTLENYIVLPGQHSPERLIADFLWELSDESEIWKKIDPHFTKQYCFKDYSLSDIQSNREKAKLWFNSHLKAWGSNAYKVINPWIAENKELADEFVNSFIKTYNKFAEQLSFDPL